MQRKVGLPANESTVIASKTTKRLDETPLNVLILMNWTLFSVRLINISLLTLANIATVIASLAAT